jgi:hypothetical protein
LRENEKKIKNKFKTQAGQVKKTGKLKTQKIPFFFDKAGGKIQKISDTRKKIEVTDSDAGRRNLWERVGEDCAPFSEFSHHQYYIKKFQDDGMNTVL